MDYLTAYQMLCEDMQSTGRLPAWHKNHAGTAMAVHGIVSDLMGSMRPPYSKEDIAILSMAVLVKRSCWQEAAQA